MRTTGWNDDVRSFVRSRGGVGVRAFDAMRCARRGGVHCDLILNVGTAFKLRERMDGFGFVRVVCGAYVRIEYCYKEL